MKKVLLTAIASLSLLSGVVNAADVSSQFNYKLAVNQKSHIAKNGDLVLNANDLNKIRLDSAKYLNCKDKDLVINFSIEDNIHMYAATCNTNLKAIVNPIL